MPELPEVETVCRTLRRHVVGQTISAVDVVQPNLRWTVSSSDLNAYVVGRSVAAVRRRAKYIVMDMVAPNPSDPASVLVVHLGMSGIMRVVQARAPRRRHDHVLFALGLGDVQLRYFDPRRFGSVHSFAALAEAKHRLFAHLGVEPLDAQAFTGAYLYYRSRGVSRCIKNWIMDASVVVGVGNIYASEALWRSGILPTMPASRLSRPRAVRLANAIVETLQDAITQGGTTLRDFSDADAAAGHFSMRLRVYGRSQEPCYSCLQPVRRIVQGNRSTYFCSTCQKR